MLTEQEATELLNEMYSMSGRFNELGWIDQASQATRMRSKVSALLHQRDEMRQKIDSLTTQLEKSRAAHSLCASRCASHAEETVRLDDEMADIKQQVARRTVECNTAIFERDEAQKKIARLEEQLAKKNTVELMMPNMGGVQEVCDAVNEIKRISWCIGTTGMQPYLNEWSDGLLKCADKIEKFFGQPMVKMAKEMQTPHAGDKLDRQIADAREDLMQARTSETWGWSARAQMATQFAAAMVGTIRNDMDYLRLRKLAERCGLPSVSAWIAAEANKQAGALLDELNR